MLCSMYSILIRSLSRYLPSKFVYLFNWKAVLCIFLKYVRTKSNSYSYVWVGICRGFLVSHYTSMCLGLLYDLLYNNNAFFKTLFSYSPFGSMNNEVTAKSRKTTPPIKVTVRTEMRWANRRPPKKKKAFHKNWYPKMFENNRSHFKLIPSKFCIKVARFKGFLLVFEMEELGASEASNYNWS